MKDELTVTISFDGAERLKEVIERAKNEAQELRKTLKELEEMEFEVKIKA